VDACAETVESLLGSCPGLIVLATSRETLRIDAEFVYNVPPLGLPDESSEEQVGRSDAVRFFVSRAAARRPGFALTRENAKTIGALCRHLEGIPLALELAAARLAVLTVEQLLDRLGDRFRLLSSSGRGMAAKQRTLRATVEWSYELLTDEERRMLRRLAVFEGGCTLAAAEEVTGGPATPAGPPVTNDAIDIIEHLVSKSLLIVDTSGAEARYGMLETIRQFALEKLGEAGEADACRRRHFGFFKAIARAARGGMRGIEAHVWLGRLDHELENLRGALRWGRESEPPEALVETVVAMGQYWSSRGLWAEGLEWLGVATDEEAPLPSALRAIALAWAAQFALRREDRDLVDAFVRRGLALARDAGDEFCRGRLLCMEGSIAEQRAELDRAFDLQVESLRICEALEDEYYVSEIQRTIGSVRISMGDYDGGIAWTELALATARRIGSQFGIAGAAYNLGTLALHRHEMARATRYLEEAAAVMELIGDKMHLTLLAEAYGILYRERGDFEQATAKLREAIRTALRLGARYRVPSISVHLAWAAMLEGDAERAMRVDGISDLLREEFNSPTSKETLEEIRLLLRPAVEKLGEAEAARIRREGREMTVAEALAYVLEESGE
jgi:predicted ATPase